MKPTLLLLAALAFAGASLRAEDNPALPELPQPATSFGAALSDNWLYIYGGNSGKAHEFHTECIKGDLFRLQIPSGKAWEKLESSEPLLGAAMATYDGRIIRVGGLQARNAKGQKNDLHSMNTVVAYNPKTQKWEALPSLPEARSSHDIVVFNDTLYVGGGWRLGGGDSETKGSHWYKNMLSLDLKAPDKGWQKHDQPFQRRALAVSVHNDRLWFLGGMDENDEPSKEVDWFEPKTNTWGKGPELPEGSMAGFGMAACATGGKLYASPLSGKLYVLSTDGKTWEHRTTLKNPRFFHRLLPVDGDNLIAVGGSNRKGQIRQPEIISLKDAPAPAPEAPKTSKEAAPEAKKPTERTDAGWPQWRGAQRDGISAETGWRKDWPAEGPANLWRAKVGLGMSSPVVAGGRLFAHGNNDEGTDIVYAFDAATGTELWRHSYACATDAHQMPIVPNGPGATPTVAGQNLFTLSREGDLFCLDVTNGQVVWQKNLIKDLGGKRPVYGYTQSPLVEGGRIYLDLGAAKGVDGSTAALDAATGEVVWRAGRGEAGYSSARMFTRDGKRLVAMFKGEAMEVFDPADGSVLWSHARTTRDFCNALTPVFVGHRLLITNTGAGPAELVDWDMGAAPQVRGVWQSKQFELLFNNAIATEGSLFAFNEQKRGVNEFVCLDANTGETRWTADTVPIGTFVLSDGHWLFLTRQGEVVIAPVSKEKLEPAARFQALPGKSYSTPTLAAGRLYVRNNEGELAAFDLRKP